MEEECCVSPSPPSSTLLFLFAASVLLPDHLAFQCIASWKSR